MFLGKMMRLTTTALLLLPIFCVASPDTVSIFFPYNIGELNDQARFQLDEAIYNGLLPEKQAIQIIGFTDEIGSTAYNFNLSKTRANSVKDYLVKAGFSPSQITLIVGKGEQYARKTNNPEGTPTDRRVDIVAGAPLPPATKKDMSVHFVTGLRDTVPAPKKSVPANKLADQLQSVSVGQTLVLNDIFFLPGRHTIRAESAVVLEQLYGALATNPKVRISIEGHVCCIPQEITDAKDEDSQTQELSLNRAKAIRDYLVKRGLNEQRFECKGFGHRRPVINPELTEEDANRNRRVELRVIQ